MLLGAVWEHVFVRLGENAAALAARKGDRQVAKEQQRLEAVLKKRQEVLDCHHQAPKASKSFSKS